VIIGLGGHGARSGGCCARLGRETDTFTETFSPLRRLLVRLSFRSTAARLGFCIEREKHLNAIAWRSCSVL